MNKEYMSSLLADNYTDKWLWGGVRWDMATIERMQNSKALENYGYKVYSQNDEDGIIEEIFNRIGTTNKTFIEFGLQDGLESNTHYLLFKDWKGLWIECDENDYQKICHKFVNVIKDGQLQVLKAFITKDNINQLFIQSGVEGEIDLLSIDIDGNDYYVFECIEAVQARVVIMEYNGKFPPNYAWKQAYNAEHIWYGSDKHGASLLELTQLASKKGYSLVGTNINGCNAFFVRDDLVNETFLQPFTSEYLYNPMRVNLKHRSGHPSNNCLYKMNQGIEGVFDFYPEENIHFVFGFSDIEENEKIKYRYMNSCAAKIYIKKKEDVMNIILNFINPFPGEKFEIDIMNKGQLLINTEICDAETEIRLKKVDVTCESGYALDFSIDRLLVPNKVLGVSDYRKLGPGLVFKEEL